MAQIFLGREFAQVGFENFCQASASASACTAATPAVLSRFANFSVSNVMGLIYFGGLSNCFVHGVASTREHEFVNTISIIF
jgi:hypothetical protein